MISFIKNFFLIYCMSICYSEQMSIMHITAYFTLDNISIEKGEELVCAGFPLTAISQQMNVQAWERE